MNTKFNLSNEKFEQNSGSTLNLSGTTNFDTTNGGDLLIDGISIKSLTGSTSDVGFNASNGLTKTGNTISFGGTLNTDTNLDLNEKYLLIRNGSFYINDEIEEFEIITKKYNSLSSVDSEGNTSLIYNEPNRLSLVTKQFDEDNSSFISLNNNASGGTVIGRSVYNELTNDFDNGRFIQFSDDTTVLTGIEQNDSNSKILTLNDNNEIEWLDVNSIVVTGETGSSTPLIQKQVTGTSYTITDEDNNHIIYFTHVSGCSIVLPHDVSENITFTSVRSGGYLSHVDDGMSNLITVFNEKNIEVVNGAATWVKQSSTDWFGWGGLGKLSIINEDGNITLDASTGDVQVKHSGDELFKINGLIDSIPHTGATLTLTEKHRGKFIYFSNECEVTIPDDLQLGFNCVLFQDSSGTITVVGDGTTINGKTETTAEFESIAILYYKVDNIYSGI